MIRFSHLPWARLTLCAALMSACAEPPAAPPSVTHGVSALVVDGSDNLAWQYPQIIADLVLQSSGELQLPYPIRDLNTGQYSSTLTFATLPESASVSAGWNASGRARLLISGSGGSSEDSLPAAAVLRNDQLQMQNRAGGVVTTQSIGRLMNASSPAEWFAANPIDPGYTTLPGISGLLGAAVVSDVAMSASNASLSSQMLGGVSRQVATVSLANAGTIPRVARYVRLRASNVANAPLTWVLREVRMRAPASTATLAPGAARVRSDQRLTIRRLTVKTPTYASTSTGLTPTSSVAKLFVIPDEPNPWDPTPIPPLPPAPEPVPPPPPPPTFVPLPPVGFGDVPVVFQHGFQSGAGDWNDMRGRLRPQLQISDAAFNVPVEGDLYRASDSLNAATRNWSGGQRVLAVAHSAGGLVARRAIYSDPSLISGLITIGTPHRGALLAERAPDAAAAIAALLPAIWLVSPCVSGILDQSGLLCNKFFIATTGTLSTLGGILAVSGGVRAARDLDPSSAFVSAVNAPAESYIRIGITHRVPRRWSFAMQVGEYADGAQQPLPWNPQSAAKGAYEMSEAYRRALITFIQSTVMIWLLSEMEADQGRLQINYACGPAWSSPGVGCGYDPGIPSWTRWAFASSWYTYLLAQQDISARTVLTYNLADWIWNKSVADSRTSDAFIAAESQQFPNNVGSAIPPVNLESDRVFGNGPLVAHLGETHSDMVRAPVSLAMRLRFGIQLR